MSKLLIAILFLISIEAVAQSTVSEVKSIAPDVFGLWLDQYENKSIIVEFENFLVLIEFPQNDQVAKDIIEKCAEMFPRKPIEYVLHSHHHVHSISSFDPFIELTKARLVTTQYNFNEIKKVTNDTLSLGKRTIFNDTIYTIKDERNQVDCYNISQSDYSVPTREYMVFFLPKQQVLVSGCLFNKPVSYFEVVNARKPALKKIIDDKELSVEFLIPTNTSRANGFEDVCSIDLFEEALVKGIIPSDFCDNIQSHSIGYLNSRMDSLAAEFKKIPRSFDYHVCANTLSDIRNDYERAIIVFKVLTNIYPEETYPIYRIAECFEELGEFDRSIDFYQRFSSLSNNEEEKEIVDKRIEKLKQRM